MEKEKCGRRVKWQKSDWYMTGVSEVEVVTAGRKRGGMAEGEVFETVSGNKGVV